MTFGRITRSLTVGEEEAAILLVALSTLGNQPALLTEEGHSVRVSLRQRLQDIFDEIIADKENA